MRLRKLAIRGLIASVLVLGFGLTMLSGSYATPVQKHYGNRAPSTEQVAFAKSTYKLMFATVFAGLSQEFAETTKDNVKEGSQSISLIFNDANHDMRLIGNIDRLRPTDKPNDAFELKANAEALTTAKGIESVEKIDGKWYYRKSTPLNNGISPACVLCHVTYKPDQKVGALVLRVPIGAIY
jgi:hypothetical protein